MVFLGFILGLYSYVIFFLGVFNALTRQNILISLILLTVFLIVVAYTKTGELYKQTVHFYYKLSKFDKVILLLLLAQLTVNSIGVFGPELGFDALWYHLTIPKIFLSNSSIFFIHGNLFYYSLFPKLVEMLYVVPLSLWSETGAKLIHFLFSLFILLSLYKLSRLFLSKTLALLVLAVFLGNPVVGWESISAYIDLGRTFFELSSFYYLVMFIKTNKKKNLIYTGILFGFLLSTKTIAFGSLPIFLILLLMQKKSIKQKIFSIITFASLAFLFSGIWYVYSYIHSGNFFYPLFTPMYSNLGANYFSPVQAINDFFTLFMYSSDPLSPVYVLFFPLIVLFMKRFTKMERMLVVYAGLALIIWIIVPRTGGSRFMLAYLPVLSILTVVPLKHAKDKFILNFSFFCIIVALCISVFYRAGANAKFLPYELGLESKETFLLHHLNFSYGDFYDAGGSIKKIVGRNTVLLYGFHNLYYADFPFVDSSMITGKEIFKFVAVQNGELPSGFKKARMVYSNDITHVKLYVIMGQT